MAAKAGIISNPNKYFVKPKILIIDDNAATRRLIEMTLNVDSYQIVQAANGLDGVRLAKETVPDLVLLDINMPGGISGLSVCDILKSLVVLAKTPVVMLSGNEEEIYEIMSYNLGAAAFVHKPFTPYGLLETIKEFLPYDLTQKE